jgi:monothiol glutaredoxin
MTENAVHQSIAREVSGNDVVLFMKGTPDFPQCGFSATAVAALGNLQVPFAAVNVLESDEIRQGIKEFSSWPTIPQLYVKGEFVGGCDIIKEMYFSGELQTLMKSKDINVLEGPPPGTGNSDSQA